MRSVLSLLGVLFGLGFIAASGGANFFYASQQAPTALEGAVFGVLSASVSGFNALLPFFISWANAKGKWLAAVGGALFLVMGILWSLSSALGFAASTRALVTGSRETVTAHADFSAKELAEAEAKRAALPAARPPAVVAAAIETIKQDRAWLATHGCTEATAAASLAFCRSYNQALTELAAAREGEKLAASIKRSRAEVMGLRDKGAGLDSDPQATLVAKLLRVDVDRARLALIVFMALLVELGAAFSIFFATAHSHDDKHQVEARELVAELLPPPRSITLQRIEPRRVRLLQ